MLNRLEQIGVLADVSSWQRFRNLRNNLAHDYPESRDQTVATLNELFETWQELNEMFSRARDYYLARAE